ncbi:MAG: hypothetical protein NZ551_07915 [Microscillaceae bacterium]|nr:hypothetical protein [Microscillaceae bacterium]MDW8461122.1 hypothetical protein [Cytophagales bacterium]
MKYTPKLLQDLESILKKYPCQVRYEKGNFKAGYCILHDQKLVVVNKYYTIEGKINALWEVLQQLEINPENLTESEQKLMIKLSAQKVENSSL